MVVVELSPGEIAGIVAGGVVGGVAGGALARRALDPRPGYRRVPTSDEIEMETTRTNVPEERVNRTSIRRLSPEEMESRNAPDVDDIIYTNEAGETA